MAGFSIASFNVLNLQDAGVPIYGDPKDAYSASAFERKVGWIGEQLRSLKAEIVGFQEVWSLAALREAAVKSGRYTPEQVFISEPGPSEGPSVALASSLPLTGPPVVVPNFPAGLSFGEFSALSTFERPVLHARVVLREGVVAHVLVAHLKSKRPRILAGEDAKDPRFVALGTARSLLQRAAEAAALRWMVIELARGNAEPVVVIGDLNDGVDSVTTQMIMGDPPFIAAKPAERAAAYDVNLSSTYNLQSERSTRDVFYTHIYDDHFETLDHILVSQELNGRGDGPLARLDALETWNDHLHRRDETRSDHGQVVARFRWLG